MSTARKSFGSVLLRVDAGNITSGHQRTTPGRSRRRPRLGCASPGPGNACTTTSREYRSVRNRTPASGPQATPRGPCRFRAEAERVRRWRSCFEELDFVVQQIQVRRRLIDDTAISEPVARHERSAGLSDQRLIRQLSRQRHGPRAPRSGRGAGGVRPETRWRGQYHPGSRCRASTRRVSSRPARIPGAAVDRRRRPRVTGRAKSACDCASRRVSRRPVRRRQSGRRASPKSGRSR